MKNSSILFLKNKKINKSYELLGTNLKFIDIKSNKVIVITSAIKGEGKTTVAVLHSKLEAARGKKILLIDCDRIRGSVHKHFDLVIEYGLLELVSGKKILEEILIKNIVKNLDVLPLKYVQNEIKDIDFIEKIKIIIEKLKNSYDIIILDTAPLMVTLNTILLGQFSDGILFVVGYNMVSKKELKYSKLLMKNHKVNIYGVIINKIDNSEYIWGNLNRY